MSYITTFTGSISTPSTLFLKKIDVKDIAHALSFDLSCKRSYPFLFYSVAQHSIACCKEAKHEGLSNRIQLGCLLHDSSEAYMSDVTRPIKAKLTEYLKFEDHLQNMIWNHFISELSRIQKRKQYLKLMTRCFLMNSYTFLPESISDDYKFILSRPTLEFYKPYNR